MGTAAYKIMSAIQIQWNLYLSLKINIQDFLVNLNKINFFGKTFIKNKPK